MATIRQIAELAQVAPNTVSLALRNSSRISAATRARIQEIAERLHYQPPSRRVVPVAGAIGCLVSYLSTPLYSRIVSGILQECFNHQHPALVLEYWHHLLDDTSYALQALIEQQVAGLLVVDPGHALPSSVILELRSRQIATVLIGGQGSELPVDTVTTDDQHLAASVIDYLLQLGHRHLLCLEPPFVAPQLTRRHRVVQALCAQRGMRMESWQYREEDDAMAILQAVMKRRPLPTALLCHSDAEAMPILHIAPTLGIRIPRQLSVVSCGNFYGSLSTTPALTTVDIYPEVLGRHATQRLITLIDQPSTTHEPTIEYVPTCLQVRQSCSQTKVKSATAFTENMSDSTTHPAVAAFLNLVRQGLTEGRIYVTDKTGGLPMRPELWGWRQMKTHAPWQPLAHAVEVGFLDGAWVLLHPRRIADYFAQQDHEDSSASFPHSMVRLKRLLADAGFLDVVSEGGQRHYTVTVRRQHTRQRLLRLKVVSLYPEGHSKG